MAQTPTPDLTFNEAGALVVPADVYVQLELIRASSRVNMMDRNGVQVEANHRSFYAAVIWLEDNKTAYAHGFMKGFAPDRELTPSEEAEIDEAQDQSDFDAYEALR